MQESSILWEKHDFFCGAALRSAQKRYVSIWLSSHCSTPQPLVLSSAPINPTTMNIFTRTILLLLLFVAGAALFFTEGAVAATSAAPPTIAAASKRADPQAAGAAAPPTVASSNAKEAKDAFTKTTQEEVAEMFFGVYASKLSDMKVDLDVCTTLLDDCKVVSDTCAGELVVSQNLFDETVTSLETDIKRNKGLAAQEKEEKRKLEKKYNFALVVICFCLGVIWWLLSGGGGPAQAHIN